MIHRCTLSELLSWNESAWLSAVRGPDLWPMPKGVDSGKVLGVFRVAEISEPTISTGVRSSLDAQNQAHSSSLTEDPLFMERQQLGITETSSHRGGLATYHGPGQLTVFFAISTGSFKALHHPPFQLRAFVNELLSGLMHCLMDHYAEIQPSDSWIVPNNKLEICCEGAGTGLWMDGRKVVSLGLAVRSRVVTHGFSVNIWETSTSFRGLNPCGLGSREKIGYLYNSIPENPEAVLNAWAQKISVFLTEKFALKSV